MDEDGQHDPAYLGAMLDRRWRSSADVVYADPSTRRRTVPAQPRLAPGQAVDATALTGGDGADLFHSYRLVLGEVARSVAAYAGPGVYLDVALGWVSRRGHDLPGDRCGRRGGRPSGYRLAHPDVALLAHGASPAARGCSGW